MRGQLPERLRGRTLLPHLNDILLMRGFLEAEGQMFNGPPLRLLRRLRTLYELLDSNNSSISSTRGETVCRKARGSTGRPWNGFMKMALLIWDGVISGENHFGASCFRSKRTGKTCCVTITVGHAPSHGLTT